MERILQLGRKVVENARGRLIFALDATMSRQATWDLAANLQSQMFDAVAGSNLSVQLVYFRGIDECRASKWTVSSRDLRAVMTTINCRSGHTQIEKILSHVAKEADTEPVKATIFVGDACEEKRDQLAPLAAKLGRLRAPMFMFQEGDEQKAAQAFREIAELSGGVYAPFDSGAAARLGELMRAVAMVATGSTAALGELKRLALHR
jgi:hypothetical protein